MDFLTVVYLEEMPLLEIHLSSFVQTTDPNAITLFTIAVNETDLKRRVTCRIEVEQLVAEMGSDWAKRIQIRDLDSYVTPATNAGYVNQQIIKLTHAASIDGENCIVLDAKNIVLQQVTRSTHFAADGRAKMHFMPYTDSYQRLIINTYYDLFGVASEGRLYDLPAMMTPFVLNRKISQELIAYCQKISGQPFAVFFAQQEHFSEFLLYATFLVFRAVPIETVYARSSQYCLSLWPEAQTNTADLRNLLGCLESIGCDYFAIHRRKLLAFDSGERIEYLGYLHKRGIRSRQLELLLSAAEI